MRVLLFSGHMIDAKDRKAPRFPSLNAGVAESAIDNAVAAQIAKYGEGNLHGICSAACGGDLLFAVTCIWKKIPVEVYLPFREKDSLTKSVVFNDPNGRWEADYVYVKRNAAEFHDPGYVYADLVFSWDDGSDPYSQLNQRMLKRTMEMGDEGVTLIVLWNGKGGDGPGGTADMARRVLEAGGEVIQITDGLVGEIERRV